MKTSVYFILFSLIFTSCKQNIIPQTGANAFKIKVFNAELKKRLDRNCIGYSYVIGYKENAVYITAGGYERLKQDAPVKKFSALDPMNPASLSKTITAIALMIDLRDNGISVKDSIYKYLPADWVLGPMVNTIIFSEILTHTSGFCSPEFWADYPVLRKIIATGDTAKSGKAYQYDNCNFNIMRILIPIINKEKYTGNDSTLSLQYGNAYIDYVNKHVFEKISIPTLTCKPDKENKSLCYQFPNTGGVGDDFGDWTIYNGGAGWNISPMQFFELLRHFRYTTSLMNKAMSDEMVNNKYGFDVSATTPVLLMHYVSKGGYFPGNNNNGEFNGQLFFLIMMYPW